MSHVLQDVSNRQPTADEHAHHGPSAGLALLGRARQKARPESAASTLASSSERPLPQCLLSGMPDEVLVEILAKLEVSDICMFVRTARQIGRVAINPKIWHTRTLRLVAAPAPAWQSMARYFRHVVSLKVVPCRGFAGANGRKRHSSFCPLADPLPSMPHLTHCGGLSDAGLALLTAMLPNIVHLAVPHMGHLHYGSLLRMLSDCPLLEHVDATNCTGMVEPSPAEAEAVDGVRPHPRLARLELNRTRLSNTGLAHLLARLPALERISLNFCEWCVPPLRLQPSTLNSLHSSSRQQTLPPERLFFGRALALSLRRAGWTRCRARQKAFQPSARSSARTSRRTGASRPSS